MTNATGHSEETIEEVQLGRESRDLSRVAGILIGIATRLINNQRREEINDDDEDVRLRSSVDRGPG
ncbi:MAG: hypothetical protein ACYCPT_14100 [Acidimicrobiales bacterium]